MPVPFRRPGSLRPYAVALALATAIAFDGLAVGTVLATIGVPSTATVLSADTNSIDGTGAWTPLSTMSVVSSAGTLKAGTITFAIRDPALFELRPNTGGLGLKGDGCGTISIAGLSADASTLVVRLTGSSTDSCYLVTREILVRPTSAGAAPLEASAVRVRCDTCGLATERTAATLTVVAGDAAEMKFSQGILSDAAAGAAFPQQPVIHEADQYGNPRAGDVFQLNQVNDMGVVSVAKCATQPVMTNASGDASFAGCAIDTPGVGYRLNGVRLLPFGSGLYAESNAFNVFGPPIRLGFKAQPSAGVTDQPFPTQPVVAVQDALGTTVSSGPGSSASVSLFLGPGAPIGASLSCAGGNTKAAVAGLATYSGCSINAATTYTLAATAGTTVLPAASLPFVVAAPGAITLSTSAPIPPGAKNPVIQWGEGFSLGVQFGANGAARSLELQGSRDGLSWTQIATLTTDAAGHASYPYRPVTNLFYRAVFAGAPDLAAATSNQVRTTVRQLAVMRPTNGATTRSIARNTAITFSTTVRPSRPELAPASVTFIFARQATSTRLDVTKRTIVVDAAGVARTTFTFAAAGRWYVRSQANPTAYNANSLMTPLESYSVR
jgi:hypothetical protein